jgi:hypothetical protein
LRFAGSDGTPHELESARILSSAEISLCPIPGLCSFFGVAGMPLMRDRVTTLQLSGLGGGGDPFDIFDLLNGDLSDLLGLGSLGTTFSDEVPSTAGRRLSVPLAPLHFEAEADGPTPSWTDLPSLSVAVVHAGTRQTGNFVLDTGAQLSLMSSGMAFDLGLDTNGNGDLRDEAMGTQEIGGIGGSIDAPLLWVEELRVPTAEGVELIFENLTVAIADIDPTIDGIFGMNLLSSGWMGSMLGDWGDLADLLNDAGMGDLLEELGGLGQGLGPSHPFFDSVHFDFRGFQPEEGQMVLDLMPEVGPIEVADGTHGDVDNDGDVDFDDREQWVHEIEGTYFGDANLDGAFNSRDMVQVFQAGEYEDRLLENSSWFTGDWNGDYEFDSRDWVLAFQEGAYEQGPRPAAGVPEPSGLLLIGCGALLLMRRRGKSRST